MEESNHKHLFPILNVMIGNAVEEVLEEDGKNISCKRGCDHCCHLLIEVSWEEAKELAFWLAEQSPAQQSQIISRIRSNAIDAKELFLKNKSAAKFSRPVTGEVEIPEELYDDYFYLEKRACPFLEESTCIAYEARPIACRLHMVTSDSGLCSRDVTDEEEYEVPEAVEQLKDDIAPVISAIEQDGRWGHFGVVLDAVLDELCQTGELTKTEENGREFVFITQRSDGSCSEQARLS